jgi:ABC-type multidrug transport system ATPase subunit
MRLEVEGVSKRYRGDTWGLRDFSLALEPGIVALLGPSGAGKSTLMRILATITRPTTGRVVWNGVDTARDPDALRAILGYLPQDFGIYPNLNAAATPIAYLVVSVVLLGMAVIGRRRRLQV